MPMLKWLRQPVIESESLLQYGKASTQIAEGEPFRVLIWNTNKASAIDVTATLNQLLQSQLTQPGRLQPHLAQPQPIFLDFLLLQEASLQHLNTVPPPAFYVLHEDYEWVMAKNLYLPRQQLFSGVKTGSRFTVGERKIWLGENKEFLLGTAKTKLKTSYSPEGKETILTLMNVHLLNFVSNALFLAELDDLARHISSASGPILVGGDFNTWTTKRRQYLDEWAYSLHLQAIDFNGLNRHRFTGLELDHVFVRGLIVEDAQVLTEAKISDHYPLLLKCHIK